MYQIKVITALKKYYKKRKSPLIMRALSIIGYLTIAYGLGGTIGKIDPSDSGTMYIQRP